MQLITPQMVKDYLPKRPLASHKGCFGRVLVVAGSRSMCGAGLLTALGALRAGAGLVAWALPRSMQPSFASALPEVITLPLAETEEGFLAAEAQGDLVKFCEHFQPGVVVCGPGMGASPLLKFILEEMQFPLVLDADGLNFLAVHPEIQLPSRRCCIFTPHPGEMARLLHSSLAQDETQRLEQAQLCAKQTHAITVLKGQGTLVATPDEVWKNSTGNATLAKGGSGDVLAGVIAGLWAQLGTPGGFTPNNAARAAICGVYLHGLAGDLVGAEKTTYGALAREVANYIPLAIKQVIETGSIL